MKKPKLKILRIVIDSPMRRYFDYLPSGDCRIENLIPGVRVKIPFGYRDTIGILIEVTAETSVPFGRLKKIKKILDPEPLITASMLALCKWASEYYHHSLGAILFGALPKLMRTGASLNVAEKESIFIKTKEITAQDGGEIAAIFKNETKEGGGLQEIRNEFTLSAHQTAAISRINQGLKPMYSPCLESEAHRALTPNNGNKLFLLDGVTGSGKTEVYLQVIAAAIQRGQQALFLVPEISLTPQTIGRFVERFPSYKIVVFHSKLTDRARLMAWRAARYGKADIVIGTRSALFTSLPNLGVIVLDEEHDLSFKQQTGFRYAARDLAIVRAKSEKAVLILGSATPSFASIHRTSSQQLPFIHLKLPNRVGAALYPSFHLIDIRRQRLKHGLAAKVISVMEEKIARGEQILLFVNRRGYAASFLCHYCGWVAHCDHCDVRLTLHKNQSRVPLEKASKMDLPKGSTPHLACHHCGKIFPLPENCPKCNNSELVSCGVGTERLEIGVKKLFPSEMVLRIDRDTTRKKGALEHMLDHVSSGQCKILLGTQMLTKGHHFPAVTMVVIVNADGGLFSADFRSSEYLAQSIIQVAGRAGRAEKAGAVYIQTHHPEHPLLLNLVQGGYHGFLQASMEERRDANFPPFAHLALLRAEHKDRSTLHGLLLTVRKFAMDLKMPETEILGPIAAIIERRADVYRAQLMLQSKNSDVLHQTVAATVSYLETLTLAKKIKWGIDIDPVEIF